MLVLKATTPPLSQNTVACLRSDARLAARVIRTVDGSQHQRRFVTQLLTVHSAATTVDNALKVEGALSNRRYFGTNSQLQL